MRASHLLALVVAVAVVSGGVTWVAGPGPIVAELGAWGSVGVAIACGLLFGGPALAWALDHDRRRLHHFVGLSAIAGALPPVVVVASGVLGHFAHGGMTYLGVVLKHGAPFPWVGLVPWATFGGMEWHAALIGAASGALCWLMLAANQNPGTSEPEPRNP